MKIANDDFLQWEEDLEAVSEMENVGETVVHDQRSFLVSEQGSGVRVDRYLATVGDWSRSFVQSMIERGLVYLGEKVVTANRRELQAGQVLTVNVPAPAPLHVQPEAIALSIVYEDEDVLIVDKPRGMVVHPAPGHSSGTLVAGIVAHLGSTDILPGTAMRPGIVHRIDKDTSGLLMIAKTPLAMQSLSTQLSEHSVIRMYEAIIHGRPTNEKGKIDAAIGRDPRHRMQMAVVDDRVGKHAVTHFRLREAFRHFSLVELRLETGRTHQIRVHLAYIGHPVAGDPLYARRDPLLLHGQALHAKTLGFTHPRTGESLLFEAPMPALLTETLAKLRTEQ